MASSPCHRHTRQPNLNWTTSLNGRVHHHNHITSHQETPTAPHQLKFTSTTKLRNYAPSTQKSSWLRNSSILKNVIRPPPTGKILPLHTTTPTKTTTTTTPRHRQEKSSKIISLFLQEIPYKTTATRTTPKSSADLTRTENHHNKTINRPLLLPQPPRSRKPWAPFVSSEQPTHTHTNTHTLSHTHTDKHTPD